MGSIFEETRVSLLKTLGEVYDIQRKREAIGKKRYVPFLMIKNTFKLLED